MHRLGRGESLENLNFFRRETRRGKKHHDTQCLFWRNSLHKIVLLFNIEFYKNCYADAIY